MFPQGSHKVGQSIANSPAGTIATVGSLSTFKLLTICATDQFNILTVIEVDASAEYRPDARLLGVLKLMLNHPDMS